MTPDERPAPRRRRRALPGALLLAQRKAGRLPAPLRRVARGMLPRATGGAAPVEGWARMPFSGAPLGPAPKAEPGGGGATPAAEGPPGDAARGSGGRRLRCLLATGVLDVGGSDEVVAFLARRLPEHAIDTVVVHTGTSIRRDGDGGGRLAAQLRQDGVEVSEAAEESASALLETYRPDVISAHGAPDWWIALAAAHHVPYVETLHGMHSFFGADWDREAARTTGVTRIVAVSELVRRQYLAGNRAVEPERVVTVPNSVDARRLPRLDRAAARAWLGAQDEFVFVSLARHSTQKNGYGLLDAFSDVARRHPSAHLLIAGRPDDDAYVHQVAGLRARLACRDRIHLRDHCPSPAALLAAADGFVLDSFFEGWALASMEALYAGVPVVASDVGGAREQLGSGGRRGHLVSNPLGDPLAVDWRTIRAALYARQANRDELVAAMGRLVEAREDWLACRAALQEESAARFHPDRALHGHATVLRQAVADGPRGAPGRRAGGREIAPAPPVVPAT